jgi:phosphoribosylformylglycinamidine synthase
LAAPVEVPSEPIGVPHAAECADDLLALLRSPRWVYRQYDHQLFLNTVVGPGGDAALLRLAGPGLPASNRGVAITTDSNPRYCARDPKAGTALTLAESVANLACVGATAVAVVDCLNFGNPEHPEVMWQFSECIDGMADACCRLGLPIIGGNVSFYNESGGADIDPTPVFGVLGLVDELRAAPPGLGWREGDTLLLLGPRGAEESGGFALGGSRWATERRKNRSGVLPSLDLEAHRTVTEFVAGLISDVVAGRGAEGPSIGAVHDVSGGGLAVAAAEMAVAAGVGCILDLNDPAELFSEAPSRFVVATSDPDALAALAEARGIAVFVLGRATGDRVVAGQLIDLPLAAVAASHEGNLALQLGES